MSTDLLKTLEVRVYKTYKCRMFASQRLEKRGVAWNASLLSMTVASAVASIGLLTDSKIYGLHGSTLLVCLSVVTLLVSFLVSERNYKGRSRDLVNSYRRLQRLSTEIELVGSSEKSSNESYKNEQMVVFSGRYNDLLDESENHTSADFLRAEPEGIDSFFKRGTLIADTLASLLPYVFLVVPTLLMIPLALKLASHV